MRKPLLAALLCVCVAEPWWTCRADAQSKGVCSAYSSAGTLATATIQNAEMDLRLAKIDSAPQFVTTSVGLADRCELSFSQDGKWLVSVVSGTKLELIVYGAAQAALHARAESEWNQFHDIQMEHLGESHFLAGFAPDDSIVVWRYRRLEGRSQYDASNVEYLVQRWSLNGNLLSEQSLGRSDLGQHVPLHDERFEHIWLPNNGCGPACLNGVRWNYGIGEVETSNSLTAPKDSAFQLTVVPHEGFFLSVLGDRDAQKAALLDASGKISHEVSLPYFPNLLAPLVPDWFHVQGISLSPDGQIAAIVRSRVAWVLVDDDRDWGSEIVVLGLHPLKVVTTLKTGLGGIRAVSVDHGGGMIRTAGHWKGKWHEEIWPDVGSVSKPQSLSWP